MQRHVLSFEPPNLLASASNLASVLQKLGESSGAVRVSHARNGWGTGDPQVARWLALVRPRALCELIQMHVPGSNCE